MDAVKKSAFDWVGANRDRLSEWHATVWDFHEPAWREYRSAAWYVDLLRREGFDVEEGSGGMPTAFCARWGKGGPVIGGYAEYDAVPGNSQDRVPREKPREGVHRWAAGHTDPHSALGIGALGGLLAAKHAMETHKIKGTLKFMGEPAEKVCGSKPIHAAKGYYDDMDAAVCWHPSFGAGRANTLVWDTHCGAYWSKVFTFECLAPETWAAMGASEGASAHTIARAPGAIDAVCLMYTTTKYTKESMLPHTGTWTINEAILAAGQATSDNLAPRFSQIQFSWRSPTLAMQERINSVLDNNAEHVAKITHCALRSAWVTKTRVGLPNHAMAEICYRNLELAGPPMWAETARAFGREIQKNLGFEPMADPILDNMQRLSSPQETEAMVRSQLPPWQLNYTSDDYVDYTCQTPTARLIVGRCTLKSPMAGYQYPAWAWNALGGYAPTIDPSVISAAKCIAGTKLDLITQPGELARARAEFALRTGGGVGGSTWVAPLLPKNFPAPIHFRWPEYVTTPRGHEWWIPEGA
ncbi:MAG: amidohydrolase [Alphaproteobacteria bacterium]|nr:amidohydrolase [Alphaproteobacteria bacterium]